MNQLLNRLNELTIQDQTEARSRYVQLLCAGDDGGEDAACELSGVMRALGLTPEHVAKDAGFIPEMRKVVAIAATEGVARQNLHDAMIAKAEGKRQIILCIEYLEYALRRLETAAVGASAELEKVGRTKSRLGWFRATLPDLLDAVAQQLATAPPPPPTATIENESQGLYISKPPAMTREAVDRFMALATAAAATVPADPPPAAEPPAQSPPTMLAPPGIEASPGAAVAELMNDGIIRPPRRRK